MALSSGKILREAGALAGRAKSCSEASPAARPLRHAVLRRGLAGRRPGPRRVPGGRGAERGPRAGGGHGEVATTALPEGPGPAGAACGGA